MDPRKPHQHVDHNDVLQLGPRYRTGLTDDLVVQVFHRTTGDGRSVSMGRRAAEELHAWLEQWLEEGWDGVTRRCQDEHSDKLTGCGWICDQDPGHATSHEGPAVHWRTSGGRPDREYWPNDGSRAGNVQNSQF